MEKSNLRLLLNAESFGFGPTAAIAAFFPYLREKFKYIGYIGKSHTLDLQKDLQYNVVYDVSATSNEEIKKIVCQYDIFVTALDFEMAALAKSVGLTIVIYDPLTWYWKLIPDILKESDLYLAQNFFGVEERIQKDSNLFSKNTKIVSPIVSQKKSRVSKRYTLINLGGLQNPLWSVEDVSRYAKIFIGAIKDLIPINEELVITTSNAVAIELNDNKIRSYNRAEMCDILENTRYAFMTPGLGNIYDVAKFSIPTVWLPPANDSQGQQMCLLKEHNLSDTQIDWSDFGKSIDYFADQIEVLKNIKDAIYSINDIEILKKVMNTAYRNVIQKDESAMSILLDTFGVGGAEEVSELIVKYCQSHK